MYVFFLRKKSDTLLHASPTASRRWLLNKQFAAAERASMPRTLRKTPVREITPQTIDWSLQGDEDTDAKTVNPKMNSGAVTGKATTSNKSADDKIEGSKPSLSMSMLPATWLLERRKETTSHNLCLTWSGQRPNVPTKQKLEHSVFPDSRASSRKLRFLDRPITKTFLEKWTPEHQERNNCLHLIPLFTPPDEEGRRHHRPQNNVKS